MDIIDINKYMTELNKALEALNMVDFMVEYNKAVNEQLVTAYNDGYVKGKEVAKKELEENGESLDPEKTATIRNEAWDCLKRIVLNHRDGGLTIEELERLFDTADYTIILRDESNTGEKVFNTIKAYLDEKAKKDTNNDMSLSLYKKQIVDHIDGILHSAHALQAANTSWPSIAQCIIDRLNGLVIDINTDSI